MTLLPTDNLAAVFVPVACALPLMAAVSVVLPRFYGVRLPLAEQARMWGPVGLMWALIVAAVFFFGEIAAPAPPGWVLPVSVAAAVVGVAGTAVRVRKEARQDARLATVVGGWLDEIEPHCDRLRNYVVDPSFSDTLLVYARKATTRGLGNTALDAFATGLVDLQRAVEASPGRGAGAPPAKDAAALLKAATRLRDFNLTGPAF
ncbi:hypothetical protein [Streptomyces sp. NPDC012746]|uniref:hypothetical protein n=1 Tax=Streptomyces sp. NPDC012746 TaxID=3364845 RepID=UPI0036C733D8